MVAPWRDTGPQAKSVPLLSLSSMTVPNQEPSMTIHNALASLAVRDIASARDWYQKLLGQVGSMPMPEVVE